VVLPKPIRSQCGHDLGLELNAMAPRRSNRRQEGSREQQRFVAIASYRAILLLLALAPPLLSAAPWASRHCNGEGCLIESRVPVGRGGIHESPAEDFPVAWLRSLLSFKPLAAVGNHFKGFRRARIIPRVLLCLARFRMDRQSHPARFLSPDSGKCRDCWRHARSGHDHEGSA
jgi:hypothetical protein